MDLNNIKIIGFDADDTLWVNEPYYRDSEQKFCSLLNKYSHPEKTMEKLLKVEIANLSLYGFGTKAFILSMVETAIEISAGKVTSEEIKEIIALGKYQINLGNEILTGVDSVLKEVSNSFELIVATKGDLLDQERKLENSGLAKYFHHIEIMSDKKESNYQKLFSHLGIKAEEFLMVGNSLKSDIAPVVNMGGKAIHIPFHTTWEYEKDVKAPKNQKNYMEVTSITEVPPILFNKH